MSAILLCTCTGALTLSASGSSGETSVDGRIQIVDGALYVPIGESVSYYTKQSFSGSYTIEMRAAVKSQAVGLMFGSGSPNPPLWILALVNPYGLWAHMPGGWNDIQKVANTNIKKDSFVTMKIEVNNGGAETYINDAKIHTCSLSEQQTSGPLGLRFTANESGTVDFIKVTQNGSIVFEDNFDRIDTEKWTFPAAAKPETENLAELMSPVWEGDAAYAESVWPIANQDGSIADIPLLYTADEILSVTNAAGNIVYENGKDYTLAGGKLRITQGSAIPITSYNTLHPTSGSFGSSDGGYMYWPGENAQIHNSQIYVTYRHSDTWSADLPENKSALLPKTTAKLNAGDDLSIVYYGDSITEGYNVSSFIGAEPYLPTWGRLVTESLRKSYPDAQISETNSGLSGKDTNWGLNNISARVNSHSPDLVVLAFGMNDGSANMAPSTYITNITAMINNVKNQNPDCEFVVVTTTLPNPKANGFNGTQVAFRQAVLNLEASGIAVADMTALHETLLSKKAYTDMTGNNINHPNDYLVRCYAQVVLQTIQGRLFMNEFSDVSYVTGSSDPHQILDIKIPDGKGPFPLVVFIHGGAWVRGDKTDSEVGGAMEKALEDGYAVASINYRYAQDAQWPAQIFDCKAAIRHLRANAEDYRIDPEQIAVWGCSAGAHLAQMMGTTNGIERFEDKNMGNAEASSEVQAVVSYYGISDVSTWEMADWLSDITTTGKDPVTTLLGDNYTEEQALDASPITHVSEKSAPMYLGHGKNDDLVAYNQSVTMADKMRASLGNELVDTYYPNNAAHAQESFWNSAATVKTALNFLQKRFRPTVNLDSDENTRPSYWTVSLNKYSRKYTGLKYADQSNTQKLSLVLPDEGSGPYPLIVFIHGGGFSGGNSSGTDVLYTAEGALQALDRGYAVAIVDYRLNPEAHFPEPIYDVKAAIRFLRANAEEYGLDSDKFAIWGESAGGLIVDFVGATNNDPRYEDLSMGNADYASTVQAVVSWYAITDMSTERNAQYRPAWLGTNQSNLDMIKEASPLNHITEDAPPFYIQHGLADNEVEYSDSVNLYNMLIETTGNRRNTLELFPGITHAVKKFLSPENAGKIIDWLDVALDDPFDGNEITKGDVDANGSVNVSDVVALRQLIMRGEHTGYELSAGDLNDDGDLTVPDVVALRQLIMQR